MADAADLVARQWWPCYLTGRVWTARQWVDMFEVDQILGHEQLRVAAAWVLTFTGEANTARGLLAGFEPSAPIPPPYEHTLSSHSSVAALRTLLAGEGGSQMLRDARLAVELEGAGSGPWRSFGFLLLGVAEMVGGDDDAAADLLRRASVEAEVLRNGVDIAALGDLSLLAGDGGRWDEAVELALEAARRAASYEIGDYLPSIPARLARDRLNAREGDADAVADMEELFEEAPRDFCPWIAIRAGLLLAEALLAARRGAPGEAAAGADSVHHRTVDGGARPEQATREARGPGARTGVHRAAVTGRVARARPAPDEPHGGGDRGQARRVAQYGRHPRQGAAPQAERRAAVRGRGPGGLAGAAADHPTAHLITRLPPPVRAGRVTA